MGTAERKFEILKYLCQWRYAKMTDLAEMFGVSVRTIHRDIDEIDVSFHVPLVIKRGKYDGGVYVMDGYSFDRIYMSDEMTALLIKVKGLVSDKLSEQELKMLSEFIEKNSTNKQ